MAIGLVLGAAGGGGASRRARYGYIPTDRQPNHAIATTHGLGNAAVVGSLFVTSYILRSRDDGRRTPDVWARPAARGSPAAAAGDLHRLARR